MIPSLGCLPDDLQGKRALVRVDFNIPRSGADVGDTTRIERTIPTIRWLLDRGARPILLSHLGRPRGFPDPVHSLAGVAGTLASMSGLPVRFVAPCDGPEALEASHDLEPRRVMLLENTRFSRGETENSPTMVRRLAQLGEFLVLDAFGSLHREHASTAGLASTMRPAVVGLLVQRELEALRSLDEPPLPFVVAFGGAKAADKIMLLESLIDRADRLLLGGIVANTFLRAAGLETGGSVVSESEIPRARDLLQRAGDKISLPVDLIVASPLAVRNRPADELYGGKRKPEKEKVRPRTVLCAEGVPDDLAAFDIGARTRQLFGGEIRQARSFFWNGPMGMFERKKFASGTLSVARAAAEATRDKALTVIGGGDSAAAVQLAGLASAVSHVSTGGGASMELIAGSTLPGLAPLAEQELRDGKLTW